MDRYHVGFSDRKAVFILEKHYQFRNSFFFFFSF